MSPATTGLAAAAVVVAVAATRPPATGRRILDRATGRGATSTRIERLGTALARRTRAPEDPRSVRTLVAGVVLGVVLAPLVPIAVLLAPGAAWSRVVLAGRRAQRLRDQEVLASLPDAVDLLLLCASGGTGLALAHRAVGAHLAGPVGVALRQADERASRGTPRADALVAALGPLGDRAAALAHVLADHLRYGTPLVPELERLGLELRLHRRRRAEEDARRVPVRLLAPLVACTLPAFALLTVAPLLVASLQQLPD